MCKDNESNGNAIMVKAIDSHNKCDTTCIQVSICRTLDKKFMITLNIMEF